MAKNILFMHELNPLFGNITAVLFVQRVQLKTTQTHGKRQPYVVPHITPNAQVRCGPGSNPGGDETSRPSRPAMWPTQPPAKWVPGLS